MTSLEVIDSAVKIGLGATITAVSAIAVPLLHGRIERSKARRDSRIKAIQSAIEDFQRVDKLALKLQVIFPSFLDLAARERPGAENARSDLWTVCVKEMAPAIFKLEEAKSALLLAGCDKAPSFFNAYASAVTHLSKVVLESLDSPRSAPANDVWARMSELVQTQRESALKALRSSLAGA